MAIISKSETEVYSVITNDLTSLGISVDSDPLLYAMYGTFSVLLSELYTNQRGILEIVKPSVASGSALDALVKFVGLERLTTSPVFDDTYTNFNIKIDNGVAADFAVDPNEPLTIKRGLKLSYNEWMFETTEPITIYPGESIGYGPIAALNNQTLDIPPNSLTYYESASLDVENLNTSTAPSFVVTNDKGIIVSSTEETDDQLRTRFYNKTNSLNNNNEQAIRVLLANYGINEIIFHRDFFGVGTLGIEINFGFTLVSDHFIDTIDSVLKSIAPYARLIRASILPVGLCFYVQYHDAAATADTKAEIITTTVDYINHIGMGHSLSTDYIITNILSLDNVKMANIISLKIDGTTAAITNQQAAPTELFLTDADNISFGA